MSASRTLLARSLCLALLAGFAGPARAVMLAPGGVEALSGTTSAAEPDLGGTVQDDPLRPFVVASGGGPGIAGALQDRVTLSDNLGTLVFAPRIRDTGIVGFGGGGIPPLEIIGLRLTGYAGFTTDVEYRTDGLGDAGPDTVSRSADGDTLSFRYNNSPLPPPDESFFLSILTDATAYAPIGEATIIAREGPGGDPFVVTLCGIHVPVSVPEPASAGLVLAGLAALTGRRWRR